MSKQTAVRFQVQVGPDHTIRLPDEIPVGPAEVIVLLDDRPRQATESDRSVLGLFADDADVIDEAMAFARERRKHWRIRPAS